MWLSSEVAELMV